MKVVLSIKPKYANKIFDGSKKFEFRKRIFKNKDIHSIVVYASSPVQKVIGEFEIAEIINDRLEELWDQTHKDSGITKEYFDDYFSNKESGFAIRVINHQRFKEPKCLKEDYNLNPPQSFAYLNE